MNIEKLVRCKIEGLQKMNKHYIAVEQSSVREEETNQSMLHRDSSITSVGDENLEPVEFELGKTIRGKECAWYNGTCDHDHASGCRIWAPQSSRTNDEFLKF
uniref:Uncharacterized protein n=1 Tax=Globodera rostochiensis TaxID=31243 RepID=A0A914GTS4_GLORO